MKPSQKKHEENRTKQIIIKLVKASGKETILKADKRKKRHLTYGGKKMKMTANFSLETN